MEDNVVKTKLSPPKNFPFPFTPYSIQEEFMRELYVTIEEKGLGVFESPTGTGKSMSLICGSLKWLFDSKERELNDIKDAVHVCEEELNLSESSGDWLDSHYAKAKARNKKLELETQLKNMEKVEDDVKRVIDKAKQLNDDNKFHSIHKKKQSKLKSRNESSSNVEDEKNLDNDDLVLLDEVPPCVDEDEDEREETNRDYPITKIYFCSRTHSQLTQLAGEIQKSPYRDRNVRVVPLASRQNLCVNDAVLRLRNLALINETCQDLRNRKSSHATKTLDTGEKVKKLKTSGGCSFTSENAMDRLRGECLAEIHDLEELASAGRKISACPYYTARNCVKDAHVVLLPYNTLLHKSTREASGIDLHDSVVIVDEAHNLLDTLGNIHSASVTRLQLCHALSFLIQYRDRYQDRFSPANLLSLNQLIFVIRKLHKRLNSAMKLETTTTTTIAPLSEFLLATEVDNINMYNLIQFAEKSRLAQKLRGFVNKFQPNVSLPEMEDKRKLEGGVSAFLKKMQNKDQTNSSDANTSAENIEPVTSGVSSIQNVLSFLSTLTNHAEDGRVVCTIGVTPAQSFIKFLLLNPAAHFRDIVSQARCVIVAGGTMQPFTEFTDQLFRFSGASAERIRTFSCNHVVPASNILPIALAQGPAGRTFDFSYKMRNNNDLIEELGRLLINVCCVVPAGVVVFFPSYEYESQVYQYFVQRDIVRKLEMKKRVLREPKQSNKVDYVLTQYEKAAPTGALLFSVVGGKLSEGLNFSDDLGRCVIVVGLPYPNRTSPELQEKMSYLEQHMGKGSGNVYYDNLCMKAVNQSIGRSVRHINDYAAVLLLDSRYSRPHTREGLPQWIKKSLRCETLFRPVMPLLASFFTKMKSHKP